MKKRSFFTATILLIAVSSLMIIFNRQKITFTPTPSDTVAAAEFAPSKQKELVDINLKYITDVDFPKYKITKQSVLTPDSISLAADEENIASGNYTATLTLDTTLNENFILSLQQISQKDSCWKIKDDYVYYTRNERNGGKYNIFFSIKGKHIIVNHLAL